MAELLNPTHYLQRVLSPVVSVALLSSACTTSGQTGEPNTTTSSPSLDIVSETPLAPMQLESLRGVASNIEGEPPRATVEREAAPDEVVELTNQCMTESGFIVDQEGTVLVPPEQEQAYWEAMYVCRVKYPPMEKYLVPLDDAQWTTRYTYWVDEFLPCLAAEGIQASNEPPSLHVFLSDPFAWRPWHDTDEAVSSWRQRTGLNDADLEEICPSDPPLDAVYPP